MTRRASARRPEKVLQGLDAGNRRKTPPAGPRIRVTGETANRREAIVDARSGLSRRQARHADEMRPAWLPTRARRFRAAEEQRPADRGAGVAALDAADRLNRRHDGKAVKTVAPHRTGRPKEGSRRSDL